MEDRQIIALYFQRDQSAITETAEKYGPFCRQVASNILTLREDAEECVNDTYYVAWNTIPPQKPQYLRVFLGRIVRNLSISRWRKNHAQKRYAGMDLLLSELEDCVPAAGQVEQEMERRALAEAISRWLESLPREDRTLFLRRYWYGDPLQELARQADCKPAQLAQRMLRLRQGLRLALEQEGVFL